MSSSSLILLIQKAKQLKEIAHYSYHLLENSEHSEIRETCGEREVNDLEKALDVFTDGNEDVHPACQELDMLIENVEYAYALKDIHYDR